MNLQMLFGNFEHLADALDAIPKLRNMILQLAVQGKLVPQDPDDEPASVLLEKIAAEKDRLIKEGKIKRGKPLPPIGADEVPYEVPEGWEWTRIRQVTHDLGQKIPEIPFTYIDVTTIDKERGQISESPAVLNPDQAPSRARKLVREGSVIYSTVRPYLLNLAIVDREFRPHPIVSTAFAVLHPFAGCYNKYLYHYLRSIPFIQYVSEQMTGMAYPAINDSKMAVGPLPLPPLSEQKRIVAKVDQLMTLCDELEERKKERDEALVNLNAACLQELTSAEPKKARKAWNRIQSHFDLLYHTPPNVAALRKSILQLAVMGRLAPQDPSDEPASVLLEKIAAEKERLIKEGKIKKGKPLPTIRPDEVPYEVPEGWEWVSLGQAYDVRDGTHDTPKYVKKGFPLVTSKNIYSGQLDLTDVKYISEKDHKAISVRSGVNQGDILFAMIGSIGNPVVINTDTDFSIKNVALFKYYNTSLAQPRYILLFLKHAAEYMKTLASGGVQSFVSLGYLRSYLIPLPPLAEQKRIVSKVDRLMALCDQLEAQLAQSQRDCDILLSAILNHMETASQ